MLPPHVAQPPLARGQGYGLGKPLLGRRPMGREMELVTRAEWPKGGGWAGGLTARPPSQAGSSSPVPGSCGHPGDSGRAGVRRKHDKGLGASVLSRPQPSLATLPHVADFPLLPLDVHACPRRPPDTLSLRPSPGPPPWCRLAVRSEHPPEEDGSLHSVLPYGRAAGAADGDGHSSSSPRRGRGEGSENSTRRREGGVPWSPWRRGYQVNGERVSPPTSCPLTILAPS